MPAYLIVLREEPVHDPEALAEYQGRTRRLGGDHKLTPRVVYGGVTGLEGQAPDGVVMLEFPSVEQAKAWYEDPAYQEALPYRLRSSRYRAFIVEGLAS